MTRSFCRRGWKNDCKMHISAKRSPSHKGPGFRFTSYVNYNVVNLLIIKGSLVCASCVLCIIYAHWEKNTYFSHQYKHRGKHMFNHMFQRQHPHLCLIIITIHESPTFQHSQSYFLLSLPLLCTHTHSHTNTFTYMGALTNLRNSSE